MHDLFESPEHAGKAGNASFDKLPLAVRMRPQYLSDMIGQEHILGPGKLLRRTLESRRLTSLIFYGPPGSGKTTLAFVISKETQAHFVSINAVTSNVAEMRKIIEEIRAKFYKTGQKSVLFIDEIHRFNKAQQDILMPYVENGDFILIGATTHNPSFVLNAPLVSRSTILELRPLKEEQLIQILKRAIGDKDRGLGKLPLEITEDAIAFLAGHAAGDARRALTALEVGILTTPQNPSGKIIFDLEVAKESCQRQIVHYDRDEDYHYDTISAFIKSMRGSDPDASVYWLAKMLTAGEDPRFIMRRMLIFASEDIGNADPQALILTSSGLNAIEFVGMPEAQIILSQVTTYLSLAPKSNASYMAISSATEDVNNGVILEVPTHLRDAHYKNAEKMGHGTGYQYPHSQKITQNQENPNPLGQKHLPQNRTYYHPKPFGFEKNLLDRLNQIRRRP